MITFKVSTRGMLKGVITDSEEDTIKIPAVVDGITVKKIDNFVFKSNPLIKSVYIPKTVKELGFGCFSNCPFLETVVFEEDSELETIKEDCFYSCKRLTNFKGTLRNLQHIYSKAFANCEKLEFIDLKDTEISDIYTATFCGSGLKKIQLPESIEHIYSAAFKNTKVDIDFNDIPYLTSIEDEAFKNSGLTSVDLSDNNNSVLIIKSEAFMNCSALKEIYLPKSVLLVHPCTFRNCNNLESVTLTMDSPAIPERTFESCIRLTSINMLDSNVSYIGESAFRYCSNLKSIAFPRSMKHVDKNAFANCDLSDEIDLTRVEDDFILDDYCFYGTLLTNSSIKLDFLNPITIIGNPFFNSTFPIEDFKAQYPFVLEDKYK